MTIPDCERADPESLRISNRGLYVQCESEDGETSSVHRLELGGPSPDWYSHKHDDFIFGFEPAKLNNEKSDEFSIFYFNLDEHGYVSVNSGTPSLKVENPNTGVAHVEHMLVDNSPSANTWAFLYSGDLWQVNRISPIHTDGETVWETILPSPAKGGYEIVEADDEDAVVWAGQGYTLTRVSVTKKVETVDLSTISDVTFPITKIRVKNGEAWVLAGTKIFRAKSMNDISLFAENTTTSSLGYGGSFAVDNNFVYLTDGKKISISSGATSQYFSTSPVPTAGKQPNVDDLLMRTEFSTSLHIEVSSDSLDGYVYMVSSRGSRPRILRVPK